MKRDSHPEERENGAADIDLFEYPASPTPYRFKRPRTLLAQVLLAGLPVAVVVLLLIFFVDLPLAKILKGASTSTPPFVGILFFVTSGWFIFPSLILSFLLNWFVHHNTVLQRQMAFVITATALSGIVGSMLLFLFGRYSPGALYGEGIDGFDFLQLPLTKACFPATSLMIVTALLYSIHMLYPRFGRAYLIVVLILSLTYVLMGVHFLGDVVFGLYLAPVMTLFTRKGFEYYLGRL